MAGMGVFGGGRGVEPHMNRVGPVGQTNRLLAYVLAVGSMIATMMIDMDNFQQLTILDNYT